jgi:hypothetical protein
MRASRQGIQCVQHVNNLRQQFVLARPASFTFSGGYLQRVEEIRIINERAGR